jgi:hypothetical protein
MSRLTDFYRGEATDVEGRTIDQIWAWDDEQLEEVHDYIQWLFPTATRSAYHPNAPVLTNGDITVFRASSELCHRLRRSFIRFLHFVGLVTSDDGRVIEGANFDERREDIWIYENHNWLRVSRVLESLQVLGLEDEANAFLGWLNSAFVSGVIGSGDSGARAQATESLTHWNRHAVATE